MIFLRKCDIKTTTCKQCLTPFFSAKFTSKNSYMFKIEHSLLISRVAIFYYGWDSQICQPPSDLAEKPYS